MYFTDYNCFEISDVYTISRPAWSGASSKDRTWSAIGFRCYGESLFKSDSGEVKANAGSVCYIPSGMDFYRESTDETLIIVHIKLFEPEKRIIEACDRCERTIIQPLFERLQNDWDNKNVGYMHRCIATVHEILEHVAISESNSRRSEKFDLIRIGIDAINANYDSPDINLAEIANSCFMSEEYFRRLYKKEFGLSPYQFIMEKRIQKASKLLQSSSLSVKDIAEQSGFRDCKYFSAVFHSKIGMSPREYRTVFRNAD